MDDATKFIIKVTLISGIIIATTGVPIAYFCNKKHAEERQRHLNAPTIEAKVIGKTFTDGWGGNDNCSIGVELPDGSRVAFSYFGSQARDMNSIYQKGDTIRFKQGCGP